MIPDERTQRLIAPAVLDRIQAEIESALVVLFMNGTPEFPQCSGSAQAAHILQLLGVRFKSLDVLKDPSLRLSIRDFSDWPTLPQLYVCGQFLGGNDVMRQMLDDETLKEFFEQRSIPMQT